MGLQWKTEEHGHAHHVDAYYNHAKYAVERVEHIIANPPESWAQYMGQPHGWVAILDMEMGEMEKAYAAKREGKGTEEQFAHELLHVAAATICLYAHIMNK